MNITATIITFNEEQNIARCIQSLKAVADEIVVVDSFSTDKTEAICRELNVKFLQNIFQGHIEQKNFAIQQAKHDYILSLDADEELSPELQQSINTIKNRADYNKAYSFNRLTSYCGQWIRHCGWYPDKKIRLWYKNTGKWGGENPHDKVILNDGVHVEHLKGDLLHYSFPTISSHIKTANSFSEIAAKEAIKKGKKVNILQHVILNPWFTFISKYFFKRGFMDGYYGFIICTLSAVSNFLKYSKIIAYRRNEENHTK